VIATGTPETVARNKASHTGRFLKPLLNADTDMEIIRSRQNPLVKHLIKLAENQARAAQKLSDPAHRRPSG
jgi:hypothetical protein